MQQHQYFIKELKQKELKNEIEKIKNTFISNAHLGEPKSDTDKFFKSSPLAVFYKTDLEKQVDQHTSSLFDEAVNKIGKLEL